MNGVNAPAFCGLSARPSPHAASVRQPGEVITGTPALTAGSQTPQCLRTRHRCLLSTSFPAETPPSLDHLQHPLRGRLAPDSLPRASGDLLALPLINIWEMRQSLG